MQGEKLFKKIIYLSAISALLTGCSDKIFVPLNTIAEDLPETMQHSVVAISDTSALKEKTVHETLRKYFEEYAQAYEKSGTQINFGTVTKKITFKGETLEYTENAIVSIVSRDMPDFNVDIPIEPSKHPAWNTANLFIEHSFGAAWKMFGIDRLANVLTAGISAAQGATYNGPLINSQNSAGGSQTFGMDSYYAGPYQGAPESPESAETWFGGIVGCSSMESYLDGKCSVVPEN